MWCVPQLDQEYLQRMEAVLEVLNRPLDKRAPVVALDERPVQLLDSLRPATAMVPGQPARATTSTRAAARPMCSAWSSPKPVAIRPTPRKIVPRPNLRERSSGFTRRYRAARTIHLVLDNLNTHREKSLIATFGAQAGHRLWRRFT